MLTAPILTPPPTDWVCVACGLTDRTTQLGAHTRMHSCSTAGGMTVPMVAAGTRGKLVMHEREDYLNGEDVQRDADGHVFMAARVVTDEQEHVAVYAPTAYANGYAGSKA